MNAVVSLLDDEPPTRDAAAGLQAPVCSESAVAALPAPFDEGVIAGAMA